MNRLEKRKEKDNIKTLPPPIGRLFNENVSLFSPPIEKGILISKNELRNNSLRNTLWNNKDSLGKRKRGWIASFFIHFFCSIYSWFTKNYRYYTNNF